MKLTNFYEVMDSKGDIVWGGASASEAVKWFRRSLDSSVFVSMWDEQDPKEPRLVTDKIPVTHLILVTIVSEREKAR